MPGMEGRYMLMPSGLTAEAAMSKAMKECLAAGCGATALVRVMMS